MEKQNSQDLEDRGPVKRNQRSANKVRRSGSPSKLKTQPAKDDKNEAKNEGTQEN